MIKMNIKKTICHNIYIILLFTIIYYVYMYDHYILILYFSFCFISNLKFILTNQSVNNILSKISERKIGYFLKNYKSLSNVLKPNITMFMFNLIKYYYLIPDFSANSKDVSHKSILARFVGFEK